MVRVISVCVRRLQLPMRRIASCSCSSNVRCCHHQYTRKTLPCSLGVPELEITGYSSQNGRGVLVAW